MKFDSLKLKKLGLPVYLIAISVIILFALIFGLIFGFNKGFDFNGGTQIVVDFGDHMLVSDKNLTEEQYINKASNEVKDIIGKNGGKIHSLQVQDTNSGKSLIINIRQSDPNIVEKIRIELNNKFNDYDIFEEYKNRGEEYKILDNFYDLTKNTTEVEGLIVPNTVIACIASLLFALTAISVYCCFRLKLAGGLTLAFGGILNLVVFCALMILSRIEINAYFFVLLGIVLIISIYNSLDFSLCIKEKLKDPKLNSKTNKELANIVLKENFIKNVSIYGVCLGIALIIGLFGVVSILHLGLATILGLVVLFAIQTFVLPDFWVLLNKKNELVRPIPKQKKDDIEVSSSKNNIDKSAKVIDVEDEEIEEEEKTSNGKSESENLNNKEEKTSEIIEEDNNNTSEDDDEVVIEVLEDTDSDNKRD